MTDEWAYDISIRKWSSWPWRYVVIVHASRPGVSFSTRSVLERTARSEQHARRLAGRAIDADRARLEREARTIVIRVEPGERVPDGAS